MFAVFIVELLGRCFGLTFTGTTHRYDKCKLLANHQPTLESSGFASSKEPTAMTTSFGSCHCGAIQFSVETQPNMVAHECNCSICTKTGHLHYIVPKRQFQLIQGQENLTTYTFGSGVAQHYFCKTCGVRGFYVPRSNPDGMDVNLRCLDTPPEPFSVEPFDGKNWEKNAHELAHLSKE